MGGPVTKVGDGVHVTRYDGHVVDLWGIIVRRSGYLRTLVPYETTERFVAYSMSCDEYTIVPLEEWPDEVCVTLAKHALLGEVSDE